MTNFTQHSKILQCSKVTNKGIIIRSWTSQSVDININYKGKVPLWDKFHALKKEKRTAWINQSIYTFMRSSDGHN